jgi:hypothetical protein
MDELCVPPPQCSAIARAIRGCPCSHAASEPLSPGSFEGACGVPGFVSYRHGSRRAVPSRRFSEVSSLVLQAIGETYILAERVI